MNTNPVLFSGSDGMSAAVLRRPDIKAPTIRALMARGAWSLKARSILPSGSASNWAAIFQCSGPEQNGYIDWNTVEPAMTPAALDPNGRFPDIVARLRTARPDAKIGYIYGWGAMSSFIDVSVCDFVFGTLEPCEKVLDWIRAENPDFLSFVFNSPDDVGHVSGWDSPEYAASVEAVDAGVARILATYEEAGLLDDTFVAFTSDHGGLDNKHGGATLDEMERPLVFAGPGVRKGYEIPWVTLTPDVGATVAHALGIPLAREWTGRVINDIFE